MSACRILLSEDILGEVEYVEPEAALRSLAFLPPRPHEEEPLQSGSVARVASMPASHLAGATPAAAAEQWPAQIMEEGAPLPDHHQLVWAVICGKRYRNAYGLANRGKIHQSPQDLMCDLCGKIIKATESTLASSLLYKHKKGCAKKQDKLQEQKCKNCGVTITVKKIRERHERKCGPQKCDKVWR